MAQIKRYPHTHYDPSAPFSPVSRTLGKAIGSASNIYGKILTNPVAERITNGLVQKGWRALLFTNRMGLTHKIKPVSDPTELTGENATAQYPPLLVASRTDKRRRLFKVYLQTEYDDFIGKKLSEKTRGSYGHNLKGVAAGKAEYKFPDYKVEDLTGNYNAKEGNQIILYNLMEQEQGLADCFIALQNRPYEIEVKPETSWAAIKSMGRNTPMYHYLGAEGSLHINTSWYMPGKPSDPGFNPYWVINQCRRLESWTMANGYNSAPPLIAIQWGASDMFAGDIWILTSASYNPSGFHDKAVIKPYVNNGGNNSNTFINHQEKPTLVDSGLVPYHATQELIFKKVSAHNLLRPEIAKYMLPNPKEE